MIAPVTFDVENGCSMANSKTPLLSLLSFNYLCIVNVESETVMRSSRPWMYSCFGSELTATRRRDDSPTQGGDRIS